MTRVLITYGSRHGATKGIAEFIGEALRAGHLDGVVEPAESVHDVTNVDAFVVGSAIYMGSWLKEPIEFLERHRDLLATKPVWLFSSGPLKGSSKEEAGADPLESALGPMEGPGSGGHRRIAELEKAIGVRGHVAFYGAFDPKDPPKAMSERFVRMMPGSKGILPPGDFRDWDAVDAWAHEIATALTKEPVPSAS